VKGCESTTVDDVERLLSKLYPKTRVRPESGLERTGEKATRLSRRGTGLAILPECAESEEIGNGSSKMQRLWDVEARVLGELVLINLGKVG
jgi:hypothetical protein